MASRLSFEAYLALEERSSRKSEYVLGWVYTMSGATFRHDNITWNILNRLKAACGGTGCAAHSSDVLVRPAEDVGYYPDASVDCAPHADEERIVDRPCVVVEVTSRSTARFDHSEKALNYQRSSSLQTYLVVEQRWRHVTWHHRDAAGTWVVEELQTTGTIDLPCLGTQLTLGEIYQGIELPPLSVAEPGWGDLEDVYATE